MNSKKTMLDLLWLTITALIVRVSYVWYFGAKYGFVQISDFLYLHQLAESLALGDGLTIEGIRIYNQSAGYPVFLSIFYKIFGCNVNIAIMINILLGIISICLVYLLTIRLFQSRSSAITASILALFYPDSLLYSVFASAENLLIPLMLLLLVSVLHDWKCNWVAGATVGIISAMAMNVKANVFFLCIFIPFIWLAFQQRWVVRTLFAALFGGMCLLPLTIMNYKGTGYFVPLSAVAGEVMLDGTNPSAVGKPTNQYHLPSEIEKGKHPVELDKMRMRQAISYIKADPVWYMKLTVKKVLYSLSPARDFLYELNKRYALFSPVLSRWLPTAFNMFLLMAIFAGLIKVRGNRLVFVTFASILSAAFLLQALFCAYSRYRYPFLFCLLPLCGYITGAMIQQAVYRLKANEISHE